MSDIPSFKDMMAFHKTPKWNPGDPNVKQFVREVVVKDPKTAGENLSQIIDEHKTWDESVPNGDKQHTLNSRRDEDLPMNQNGVNKPRETVTDVLPDGGYRYDYEFGNKLPTEREFDVTERGGTDIAPVGLNDRAADAKWTVENLKPFRDLISGRITKMIMDPNANYARYAQEPKNKAVLANYNMSEYLDEQAQNNATAMQNFSAGRTDTTMTTPAGKKEIPEIDMTEYFHQQNSDPEVLMNDGSGDPVVRRIKPAKPLVEEVEDYGTREPIVLEEDTEVGPVESATPEDVVQDDLLHQKTHRELENRGLKDEKKGDGEDRRSGKLPGKRPVQKPKYKTEAKRIIPTFRDMMSSS